MVGEGLLGWTCGGVLSLLEGLQMIVALSRKMRWR